jgi:hypothetical protein
MMYVHYSRLMFGIYLCHTTQHPTTHIRNKDDNNGSNGNAEGDDRLNGTIVE